MTAEDLARMSAQIQSGISKDDSTLVTDQESSAAWDELVAYFDANPGIAWDVPSEWGQSD